MCHHPDKSGDHRHCDSETLMFLVCHVTSSDHVTNLTILVEAPHDESPSSHVSWPLVYCKWRYKMFKLLHDLARAHD